MPKYNVFIDGRAGTTGLRIEEYLSRRSDINLIDIDDDMRKDPDARLAKMREADVTFLCLPDAGAIEIANAAPKDIRIIDASTAHRIKDDWVYGMPELTPGQRDMIRNSNRIALPGCHASGFILLVRPLIDAGFIPKDYPFAFHSITGYSGGGKSMIADYESAGRDELLQAPRLYALTGQHKHLPEMTKYASLTEPPIFTPHVADYYSGLSVIVPVSGKLLDGGAGASALHEVLKKRYEGERFISVAPLGCDPESGFLSAGGMSGRNDMELFVFGTGGRILLTARYDNLGKGASGAGVQCMNLMLGISEQEGLL
jgi:N-acetyl-gamma-glutamyl-phosphate reductase